MINLHLNFFLDQIIILMGALLLDVVIGEFPEKIHPVVWTGKLIEFVEPHFRKSQNKLLSGTLLVVSVEILFVGAMVLINYALFYVTIAYIIISVFFVKSSFALRSMRDHIEPIISSIEKNDLEKARIFLSRTVRRETAGLPKELICSAAIETISEGLVDGFTGPLFYFSFFFLPGSFFYRVANTFDSEIGYNDDKNRLFGRFAAHLDTLLNYIPSRLTAYVSYISAYIIGLRPRSLQLYTVSRKTASRNAGWPMGAFSNIIGVRLEKKGEYILNDDFRYPDVEDVRTALKLHSLTSAIFTLVITVPILIFLYIFL